MSALRIISNVLNHSTMFQNFEVLFGCQELQTYLEHLLATCPGLPYNHEILDQEPVVRPSYNLILTIEISCLPMFQNYCQYGYRRYAGENFIS